VKKYFRLKPLAIVFAMVLIHISSTEVSFCGFADRILQFAVAYVLIWLALYDKGMQ